MQDKTITPQALIRFLQEIKVENKLTARNLAILCIGTDRSTGDSLGPLTGMLLEQKGYPYVVGTLKDPCDAKSIHERLRAIPSKLHILAIDACLGRLERSGRFIVGKGSLEPGKALGLSLPPSGHWFVKGIVNGNTGNRYHILQETSLYRVWTMAEQVADAILAVFPVEEN